MTQPLYCDDDGDTRFKANEIVRFLLDKGGLDLNDLSARDFSQADWEQFYQLIGYSLRGYHELSKVSDASALRASALALEAELEDQGCRTSGCFYHCGIEVEDEES